MTLNVPFEQFAAAIHRLLGGTPAYLSTDGASTVVSAADPTKNLRIASVHNATVDQTREALKVMGLETHEGKWLEDGEPLSAGTVATPHYVAAVAYKTGDDTPGVWVDAYAEPPTQVLVLRALYEDFRSTGELADVSFEEFVRLANPNVVITTPDDLSSYVRQKEC